MPNSERGPGRPPELTEHAVVAVQTAADTTIEEWPLVLTRWLHNNGRQAQPWPRCQSHP